jgi:predicted dehydrogenase
MKQRINFHGKLADEPEIRVGFIGCGSHSFRNIYPTFQFAPVDLIATCDLDAEKAGAFARKFGASASYSDHREMLRKEKLDAVFIVTGYDGETGRPLYPRLARDCLEAGLHVWIEKPPALSCGEIDALREVAEKAKRNVMVGLKKMFFPANEKAKELAMAESFGSIELVLLQYPQRIPTAGEFASSAPKCHPQLLGFLDHLCHPAALLVYLLGMPRTLYYERSRAGAGNVIFGYGDDGPVASLAMSSGSSHNGGMERTTIVSSTRQHILVDNNHRVSLHRNPPEMGYGNTPDYFSGNVNQVTAVWDPEFSLGQLYNKGLFLLGYYNEVNEFARSILEKRPVAKGDLNHAWQVTRIFEAFAQGPGKVIAL